MFFGTARTTKATAAAELAALGAWAAFASGDRVGAVIFGDNDIVEIKPHRSRANVMRICHELVRLNSSTVLDLSFVNIQGSQSFTSFPVVQAS